MSKVHTIKNSFFEWMVADLDQYTYERENLKDIEKEFGVKIKSWECWWDSEIGCMYSYDAYILWEAEDGRCGYDTLYHYHYPHDDRDETSILHYGPFKSGEWIKMCGDIKKEMDERREEHREDKKRRDEWRNFDAKK